MRVRPNSIFDRITSSLSLDEKRRSSNVSVVVTICVAVSLVALLTTVISCSGILKLAVLCIFIYSPTFLIAYCIFSVSKGANLETDHIADRVAVLNSKLTESQEQDVFVSADRPILNCQFWSVSLVVILGFVIAGALWH